MTHLEERLLNVDLDVEKSLLEIPKDENNAFIYVRVCLDDRIDPKLNGYLSAEGSGPAMISVLVSMMQESKELKKCVKQALNLLK